MSEEIKLLSLLNDNQIKHELKQFEPFCTDEQLANLIGIYRAQQIKIKQHEAACAEMRQMLAHILNCFDTAPKLISNPTLPVEGQISVETFNKAREICSTTGQSLLDELKETKEKLNEALLKLGDATSDVNDVRAELTELRKNREMLDWFEANKHILKVEIVYNTIPRQVCISVYNNGIWKARHFGNTFREVLTAAMKGK